MTTSTTTINDNNTTTDLTLTTMTVNATVNLNNSNGDDTVTADGNGTTTVNANNSSGDDTITVNNAGSATVNLNNSTGSDDVDISDMTGSPLSATVNLNNSTGVDDNVSIAGMTVNATVNLNGSGQKGYKDDVSITGANVAATVNLNNSLGDDDITIVGTSSTNATVNLNNSGGNDNITIGSTTGVTTATVNLNSSGGTDIVNVVGATTTATVSLTNSTGKGDVIKLVGQGTGKIDATNSIGNDTLIGANGTDTITGGIGNDTVDLEGGGTINAGAGNDLGIYTLSDHYSLSGGVLQSIHGDVDYYYGQAGTNTLRLVLTQDQANLAAVQADLAAYSAFLATHPSADQTYTFHFGAAAGALTVAGWQTLQTALVTPVMSGTAREGQTLTASVTVTGGETGTTTYQWQISANGSTGWANIGGATGSTYTPNETDENHYLRVQAVFTDGIGETVTATSAPTATVLDQARAVSKPLISGAAQEGQTLTTSAAGTEGDWAVTYQWQRDGTDIFGATGASYVVKEGDEGHKLDVVATTKNDNGATASQTSAVTGPVTDITLAFTAAAAISGTAKEGSVLSALNGALNDSDAAVTGYQWQISADGSTNWTNIGGATASTYTPVEGDETQFLRVVQTATDSDGGPSTTSTSAATGPVSDITLAFTAAAAISGTAKEGSVLSALNGALNDSDAAVTGYQWQISADGSTNWINIGGATASTYTPVEGDETQFLRVVQTATDSDGGPSTTSTSAATSAVSDITLAFTTAASITGTAQEGQVLSAVNGSLNDSDAAVTGYQWQISADGSTNWTNIGGATASTYTPVEGDETQFLRVVQTATDSDGGPSTTSTSAATSAVSDITLAFTAAASITGTAQEGQVLSAVNGSLNDSDAAVTGYQWQISADGSTNWTNIGGATASTYTPVEGDETQFLRVVQTATDSDGGPSTTSTSAATGPVSDITLAFTAAAAISGTAKEGSVLSALNGALNDSDAAVTGYQWQISADGSTNWTNIGGATASTYTPVEGDETQFLRVVQTATDSDGGPSTTSTSAATGPVSDITLAFTTAASITGTAQEGQVLSAVNGTLNDTDGAVTGYQWTSDGADIAGATAATYTVTEADETHVLRVVETATDSDGGPSTSSTSAPTAAVSDIPLAFTSAAAISGTAQEGQVLSAVNGSLNDSDAAVTGYQWTRDGVNISGATSATYSVVEADETHALRVVQTATDSDGGPSTTSTSAATSAVSDITLAFTTAASITGTAQEGQVLSAVNGSLNDSDAAVTGYQWQISADGSTNWTNIGGATASTYTPVEGDETQFLRVVQTATDSDAGPSTTSTSAVTGPVTDITLAFTAAAAISGTAKEGSVLSALNGALNDSDAAVTGYQWQISADGSTNWINIGGATASTYTPVEGDETQFLRVVQTATDSDGGPSTTSTSAATSAVSDITLAFTTAASITGTAQEGQVLSAVNGSLNDSDAAVTGYQWQISADGSTNWTNIGGATASTYTPVEGDETQFLRVVQTATDSDAGPSTTSTSAVTGPVTDITLAFTAAAAISGTAKEGSVLSALNGALNDSDAAVTGYQWQISADGSTNWTNIGGATASTYTPVEGDETQFLRVVQTATDSDGGPSTTSTSAATGPVSDITLAFTAAAAISGTAKEGSVLSALNGALNDSDAAVTGYQWQISADGSTNWTNIGGATASTYTPVEGDETQFLRVVQTATASDGGPSTTSTSAATGPVSDITLAFTTAASITGTAQEGQVLSAVNGSLNDSDAAVTGYQWTRDGVNISGATASTYSVVEADETHVLRVVETATDSDGGPSTSSTSAPTAAVSDIPLAFTTAAAISGTAQEGQVLSAVNGSLNDSDAAVTGYQWTRDGVNISGATSATYSVVEADETHALRVVETASDSDGGPATTSTSAATSAVSDITLAFTTAASITGTAQEGQVLSAVNGSLSDSDAAVTGYQWTRDGANIGGATSSTYSVVEADETHVLRVVETATDSDGGPTTTSTSAPTSAVSDITLAFTTAASITGTAQEGQVLTAVNGTLNDTDGAVTGYQWTRDGVNIGGATSSTYSVVEADETHALRVVETATDSDGGPTTTSTSAPTSAVSDITLAFTTAASITGTAQESQVLSAVNGSLNDSDAAVTGYQWTSDGVNISGATSSTYTVVEADETRVLRVVETATDNDGGPATTSTSAPTAAVSDIPLAFTSAAAISGTAQEGQVLSAVNGSLNDTDGAVTGYQWTRDGVNIGGATSSTYSVVEADETHALRVVETASDSDGGPATTSTSAATSAVSDITLAFTTAASITGTAQEGQVLSAVNGSLNDSDAAVTGYQWTRDGVNIGGATSSTYTVVEADETHVLRVVETATDSDGGPTTTSTSAATSAVSDITLAFTTAASITGTAQEGQVLSAVNGSLNDSAAAVTGYQWTRDGVNIGGATSSTYTVVEADETHVLRVVETASDSDGGPATTSTSAATSAVSDITLAFTTAASITGTAQEGQVLSAVNGSLNDSDAAVTGYQWTRDGVNIGGATSSTYTVVEADETHVLRVVETATDSDGGPTTTSTSAPTSAVSDITLAFTTAASITGTAQEGQVLSAVNGSLNDSAAAVTGYQWTRDGANIGGATNQTYTVAEADEGHVLRVVETATDSDGGPSTTSTSAPTAAVSDITLAFITAASITGTAKEGTPLTAVDGTLNDSDASVTGYQWEKATTATGTYSAISGATSSTYTPVEGDETDFLKVVETASDADNGGGTATSTSAAVGPVADQPITTTITGTSSRNGNAQDGTATYTITFAEAVTGLTSANYANFFSLSGTGSSGASLQTFTANSSTSYTVTAQYKKAQAGNALTLTFTNIGTDVHDSETGESGNAALTGSGTAANLGPAGIAGDPINLALDDPSGVGAQTTITVSGMPSDWSLNQGINNGDGSWTAQTSDPSALTVTAPATFAGAMVLNVTESWTNADGSVGTASVSDNVEAYPASPIFAVSGDDTLTGGTGGNNEFVFAQPIGNDTIYNFTTASDAIDLIGFGLSEYGALTIADDANGEAVVALGTRETITVKGVDASALSAGNFVFDTEPVSTTSGTMTVGDGAILPLGGTVENSGTIAVNSTGDESDLEIQVRGASLTGGGHVALSDNSQNVVFGGDATAVFTNVDNTISGAGQLGGGQMTLVNEGMIDASGSNPLVVDTGSNTIVNTGTLEASGSGGMVINSAVSGGGNAVISGPATLEFAEASDANVTFAAGAVGMLKLDQSGSFTGTVSEFAAGGGLDLTDISFGAGATLGYAANASGTGGTLTVSDGVHTTNLALLGQYAAAGFQAATGQGGGTIITYMPAQTSTTDPTLLSNPQHTA